MPEQPSSTGAVFLSYASQDAEAAARICETLRAAGVEVWFDKSELRGGDAWDMQIKKQIHDCALFVPLISSNTNSRIEGYFRREWNLAKRRLLDRAEDAAFLLPVVIDDTREGDARVPEEFLHAQWTRLPGGETPPAFAHRVRELLGGERAAATHASSSISQIQDASTRREPPSWSAARGKHRSRFVVLAVGAMLLILSGGLYFYYVGSRDEVAANSTSATAIPAAAEKSIAVLPFADMSAEKNQAYMSDGIAEELLNVLAQVPDLKVIARTSSFAFKGQNVEVPEIARRLNVAHVLEGSVRTSGNRLQITARLVRASDSTHLWSERYDRPMGDIFAVQDEIAGAVVAQLKIRLLDAVPKVQKTDPKAYALFLKAIQSDRQLTHAGIEQSIALYQQALAIDPAYTAAWNGLAVAYSNQAWLGRGPRSADESFTLARETANTALAIDPNSAPAHALLGWIALAYNADLPAAAQHLEQALALDPTDPYVLSNGAEVASNLGHRSTAISLGEHAVARDPVNTAALVDLAFLYYVDRRFDDAIATARSALAVSPISLGPHYRIGVSLLLKGDGPAALREMRTEPDEGWRLTGLALVYHALGKTAESNAALAELIKKHEKSWSSSIAWVLAYRGDANAAFMWMDKAVANHDAGVVHFHLEPLLSNVHDDPRWVPFLQKIGTTPKQLAEIKFDVKLPQSV